ncbi:MAG: thermonuclease family protein [Desulfobacterales bacterium]|nr:MAG: thermonuclease family protein [Desulfobacterales bacterium]
MKRYLLLIFLLLAFFATTGRLSYAEKWYQVKWVVDGDTIVLRDGRAVRYIGINAPEIDHENQKAEPFGYKAREFNAHRVRAAKIRLELDQERHDQYGRLLAFVFLADGTFINAAMIAEGYAFYLYRKPNVKYAGILLQSQRRAMTAGKGMWQHWSKKDAPYLGNQESRRFHLATCPFAKQIKRKNRVTFSNKWEAFWAGYAPAKKCITEYWNYDMSKETK